MAQSPARSTLERARASEELEQDEPDRMDVGPSSLTPRQVWRVRALPRDDSNLDDRRTRTRAKLAAVCERSAKEAGIVALVSASMAKAWSRGSSA